MRGSGHRGVEAVGMGTTSVEPLGDLMALEGRALGDYTLRLGEVQPLPWVEQARFGVYLERAGRRSRTPVFSGVYSAGRPSLYIPGWMDGIVYDRVGLGEGELDVMAAGLAGPLMAALGGLIPPGGRMWLAYEAFAGEGPIHWATREGLALGLPLVVTPLGYLLYLAGCWCGLRDWYIPEGWREGPRKVQGNRPVDAAHARRRAAETVRVLEDFLSGPAAGDPDGLACARAQAVLEGLRAWLG